MRKKLTALAAILVLAIAAFTLAACNNKPSGDKASDVSRITDAYYAGEDAAFAVTVECGKREKPFIADGIVSGFNAFCEITVVPLVKNQFEKIDFELTAEGSTLNGSLESNGFGEFVSEIDLNFAPDKIKLTAGETASEIELSNVLEGALSSGDAINIARSEFAERIAAETKDGKLEREIFVKIISGDRANYYYYVSFIGKGVDYWAMLIDPRTGEVKSKK